MRFSSIQAVRVVAVCLFLALSASSSFGQSFTKTINFNTSRLLADPSRPRVYALSNSGNNLAVIDTTSLSIVATLNVGSSPVDLSLSPDNSRLYVANSGASIGAIQAVDLASLQVVSSFNLPKAALAIAAGLGNRLYAIVADGVGGYGSTIYQLDATTGAVQGSAAARGFFDSLLQISPDRKTLYSADAGYSPCSLASYDVSGSTVLPLQYVYDAGTNSSALVISHNGRYLCQPSGGGNNVSGSYNTALFSTADITTYYGIFATGAYPGPLAFSIDDSLVYQYEYAVGLLKTFDTTNFALQRSIKLPTDANSNALDVSDMQVDNTGSYLFVGQTDYAFSTSTGKLLVYTLGGAPPTAQPTITSAASATGVLGQAFNYQITATGAPTKYLATGLPPGLTVNQANGLISGTPTASGTYTATLFASNAVSTATAALLINVAEVAIVSADHADVLVGQPFSFQVLFNGLPATFNAVGLPAGLSIDSASGLISGTTNAQGLFRVTLTAANRYGSASAALSLQVAMPAPTAPPAISSALNLNARAGKLFSYQIIATNSPTSYAAAGLPAGLSFDAATGIVSGVLPPAANAATYTVALSATNGIGVGSASLTLTLLPSVAEVSIVASTSTVHTGSDETGVFVLSREGDLSADLTVNFSVKSTAVNGADYQQIKTSKKIKAGKDSVSIRIRPMGDLGGADKKVVKLALQPGDGYFIDSDAAQAKVKILRGGN